MTTRSGPPQSRAARSSDPGRADAFARAAAGLRAERVPRKPRLRRIAIELRENGVDAATTALRDYLATHPTDAEALYLMAQATARLGHRSQAQSLLERCLDLAPDFAVARYDYASLLNRWHEYGQALCEVERLLIIDHRNPLFRQLKAAVLAAVGEDEQSLAIREQLAAENPGRAECWIACGDALRALGRQEESIKAYRNAIECRPYFGAAWWSLANMKTVRFGDADVGAMKAELECRNIRPDDRVDLLFSLGKAFEDLGAWSTAFEHYAKANAARRLRIDYDWGDIARQVAVNRSLFTPEFLRHRNGVGCRAPDPIFILGRPRSGSTLIEQILCSHSAVEGTAELPYIADFARRLAEAHTGSGYPQVLGQLEPAALTALGEEYLERTRAHRKLGRPFFIDKAPANYHHVGMIHLILPNARIIDARRNPAACCFSMFKHNYTDTNLRLNELGRVYRDYVALLEHFDRVLPARVHRVIYENMIADPEAEVRGLLDYLGLPFEEQCLRFYETKRTIRTPSSEQVRRPISAEAVEHWRHFEPWLAPLVHSLGAVLADYPAVPEELR